MMRRYNQPLFQEVTPRSSKAARLRPHVDTILGRRIWLPQYAPWRADFVAEFVEFPHGDFTDQVDATTQYLDWIGEQPNLVPPPARCMGVLGRPSRLPPGTSTRVFARRR